MFVKSAKYLTSVAQSDRLLKDDVPEFAFVGRSNVGKSSLINFLVGQKRLAKTSSTPGLTKMVNYFLINESFRFVDLPGYGFAKIGRKDKNVWAKLIEDYLLKSESLQTVFVLVDIRHEPSDLDKQMIKFLVFNGLPFMVIATKCDKLSSSKMLQQKKVVAKALAVREEAIILTSSESGLGRDKILEYIDNKVKN